MSCLLRWCVAASFLVASGCGESEIDPIRVGSGVKPGKPGEKPLPALRYASMMSLNALPTISRTLQIALGHIRPNPNGRDCWVKEGTSFNFDCSPDFAGGLGFHTTWQVSVVEGKSVTANTSTTSGPEFDFKFSTRNRQADESLELSANRISDQNGVPRWEVTFKEWVAFEFFNGAGRESHKVILDAHAVLLMPSGGPSLWTYESYSATIKHEGRIPRKSGKDKKETTIIPVDESFVLNSVSGGQLAACHVPVGKFSFSGSEQENVQIQSSASQVSLPARPKAKWIWPKCREPVSYPLNLWSGFLFSPDL